MSLQKLNIVRNSEFEQFATYCFALVVGVVIVGLGVFLLGGLQENIIRNTNTTIENVTTTTMVTLKFVMEKNNRTCNWEVINEELDHLGNTCLGEYRKYIKFTCNETVPTITSGNDSYLLHGFSWIFSKDKMGVVLYKSSRNTIAHELFHLYQYFCGDFSDEEIIKEGTAELYGNTRERSNSVVPYSEGWIIVQLDEWEEKELVDEILSSKERIDREWLADRGISVL